MDARPLTLPEIKKRAVKSFVSLTGRQIALRAISFISLNVILARILPVETLGIFNIATAIITFFAFFSDIGLAASLIQKKETVTQDDIATVFTIQSAVVGLLSLIIIVSAPALGNFYGLQDEGVWLIRVLGLAFFLSSLKVVPSVILERHLNFNPLVVVEIVETLVFNGLLIWLTLGGGGILSFSIAAFLKSLIGVVLIYLLAPVKLRIRVNTQAAKKLLSFGIPYQVNTLLALLKDRLVPLVIARLVGPTGIGLVTWSQALAFLPLEVMNVVNRITFPAFSRLQDNQQALSRAVEKSLFATALLTYPALFGLGAILPFLVTFVVSTKWQPAISSFYLFAFATYWAVISTTFTNLLNSIGQIKTTLKLMVMWTVLTWLLTPALVLIYGFIGVAIASFLISFTSVITIILVKRILVVRVMEAIFLPTIASLVMAIIVYWLGGNFIRDLASLVAVIIIGGLLYSLFIMLLGKDRIFQELRSLKNV